MTASIMLISFGAALSTCAVVEQNLSFLIIGVILYLVGIIWNWYDEDIREQRIRDLEDIQDEMLGELIKALITGDTSNIQIEVNEVDEQDDSETKS